MADKNLDTHLAAARIRLAVLHMTNRSGASHIGSCFSAVDILAVLYGSVLSFQPENPEWQKRDRFILSKGHAAAALYATLAEYGFIGHDALLDYYTNGSSLMGHASHKVPGVEFSTGSLGHGLPVAVGIAKAAKLDGRTHRTFAVLSDGECDEGSNWEAILFAAHHNLNNLIVTIDYNKIQSLTTVANTLNLEPFADKWRAFGWHVQEVDGHDHMALNDAFNIADTIVDCPKCIIAHTIKGKGVSFMENSVLWHYRSPKGVEFTAALAELSK